MSESKAWLVLAGIAAAFCLYLALKPARESSDGPRHPAVGRKVKYLELQPLTGDSRHMSLNDLSGKVVLLNFWGTWCPPCVQEFPHIVELGDRYANRPDFRLLAVSCGGGTDDELDELRGKTETFLKNARVNLPTYADQHASTRQELSMVAKLEDAMPTTLIFDRDSVIRGVWVGYSPAGIHEMQSVLEELFRKPSQPQQTSAPGTSSAPR